MLEQWEITDHVCKCCFGRVITRAGDDGSNIARCADCGFEAISDHTTVCACGALPAGSKVRLRCIRHDSPTPEVPFEIVVIEAPTASNTASRVGGNLVTPKEYMAHGDAGRVMLSEEAR